MMPTTTTRLLFPASRPSQRHRLVELKGSRDGSSEGLNATQYTRRFRLFIDMQEDEFDPLLHPNPSGIVRAFIPYGTAHPWNAYAQALVYNVETQEAPGRFIVSVRYIVPEPTNGIISTGWLLSSRSLALNVKRYQTTDGETIGPRVFLADAAGPFRAAWKEIDEDGNVVPKTQRLSDSELRKEVGFDVQLSAVSLTMTRVVSQFNVSLLPVVVDHAKKLNSEVFMGADPGFAMFEDWSLDEVPPTEFEQAGSGVTRLGGPVSRGVLERFDPIIGQLTRAVRMSLTFISAQDPENPSLSPFDASWFSTYPVDNVGGGGEAVVTTNADTTQPVIDRQNVVARRDFNAFLRTMMG